MKYGIGRNVPVGISCFYYLHNYLLTYAIEQSHSWRANRFSDSQEIPCILWNPKFQYRIHTCAPPVHIMSKLDPMHAPTSLFLNIYLNINLPSTHGSSKWSLFAQVSPPKPCRRLSCLPYVLHSPPTSFFSV